MARHIPAVYNVTYGNISKFWDNPKATLFSLDGYGCWVRINKEAEFCYVIAGQVLNGRLKVIAVI